MAQTEGKVKLTIKNKVGYNKWDGTYAASDGATPDEVTLREALALSLGDAVLTTADILINPADFKKLVTPANEPDSSQKSPSV